MRVTDVHCGVTCERILISTEQIQTPCVLSHFMGKEAWDRLSGAQGTHYVAKDVFELILLGLASQTSNPRDMLTPGLSYSAILI